MFETLAALVVSTIIGFALNWKICLFLHMFTPLVILSSCYKDKAVGVEYRTHNKGSELMLSLSGEAIANIRTVAGLGREQMFVTKFVEYYDNKFRSLVKGSVLFSVFLAAAICLHFFVFAFGFMFGAFLIQEGQATFFEFYTIFAAFTLFTHSYGKIATYIPVINKGREVAGSMFEFFSKTARFKDQSFFKPKSCEGELNFDGVGFYYPSQPSNSVLSNIDLLAKCNRTSALVGESGCGKSSIIQLILKFYSPSSGIISLDGVDISNINTAWYRRQIGFVSQEPVLFDESIRDNIAYGDTSRDVGMDEIIDAAINANIHEFVSQLPRGYDTLVGERGIQISGGQKQRIAIARALIRKPKVLLLDEATSALDYESENLVQEALDRAQQDRTSIVVAHRLSTIQNSESIYVIKDGQIVENGRHNELMKCKGGHYNKLYAKNSTSLKS